jgi:hypothetical protein
MNAIRTLAAAVAVCAAGAVHAIEITEFPLEPASTLTREAVRAEALAAARAKQLRYDTAGPAVMPMSSRTREEVRREASWSRMHDEASVLDYVGGM